MAFKLAVADLIGVKVEGSNRDEHGNEKPFKFTLVCERYSAEQMKAAVGNKDETAFAFLERVARDWQGQRLVLDDAGEPAPFGLEALRLLLSISGMAMLCWQSYLAQVQATAKN